MEKKYDILLKELFPYFKRLINILFKVDVNFHSSKNLVINLPKFIEKRPDILFWHNNKIYHIEFQLTDEKDMLYRMLIYYSLILSKYKTEPIQAVIYIGESDIKNMENSYNGKSLNFKYRIISLKDIDGEELLNSPYPEDWIISLLCKLKDERIAITKIL